MEEILILAFKYGGPFAVLTFGLIYFMRKDHRKDYEGVTSRLNTVEDYQKNKMTDTLDASTKVIAENSKVIEDVRNVIQQCRGRGN